MSATKSKGSYQDSIYQMVTKVIQWSTAAASQQFTFFGQEADDEGGMGLWQSFQATFPKQDGIDYDMLILVYGETFKQTLKALKLAASSKA